LSLGRLDRDSWHDHTSRSDGIFTVPTLFGKICTVPTVCKYTVPYETAGMVPGQFFIFVIANVGSGLHSRSGQKINNYIFGNLADSVSEHWFYIII
jgi:hypothetical protein